MLLFSVYQPNFICDSDIHKCIMLLIFGSMMWQKGEKEKRKISWKQTWNKEGKKNTEKNGILLEKMWNVICMEFDSNRIFLFIPERLWNLNNVNEVLNWGVERAFLLNECTVHNIYEGGKKRKVEMHKKKKNIWV